MAKFQLLFLINYCLLKIEVYSTQEMQALLVSAQRVEMHVVQVLQI